MRIAVASVQTPFTRGAARQMAEDLVRALAAGGHEAELLHIPFTPGDPAQIPDQMLACRLLCVTPANGAPIDRLIALNFPAYLVPHPHKTILLSELFEPAYELWEQSAGNLVSHPEGRLVRDMIRRADTNLLVEAKRIFVTSDRLAQRLRHLWNTNAACLAGADAPSGDPTVTWNVRTLERLLA